MCGLEGRCEGCLPLCVRHGRRPRHLRGGQAGADGLTGGCRCLATGCRAPQVSEEEAEAPEAVRDGALAGQAPAPLLARAAGAP